MIACLICFPLPINQSNFRLSWSFIILASSFLGSCSCSTPAQWATGHSALVNLAVGATLRSTLIIATPRVLSATLFVTGSWQSPIRACTKKQREANEISVAVLLLLLQQRHAEPIRSEMPPLLLIVCILAFVSIFVQLYFIYLILLWPTFMSLVSQYLVFVLNQIKLINVLLI